MDESLASVVGELLAEKGLTLATAESCTGGWLGAQITSVPGSSRYYLGGYITYSNEAKVTDLRVPLDMLDLHGAVSEAVARAMAEGAMLRMSSDYAIAVTGVAGPGGDGGAKPVGTVWIAIADRKRETVARCCRIQGGREEVRAQSVRDALGMLRDRLLES